jgi:hypothetical protein
MNAMMLQPRLLGMLVTPGRGLLPGGDKTPDTPVTPQVPLKRKIKRAEEQKSGSQRAKPQ